MKHIGAHVSAAGGLHNAPKAAAEIGADAFALFTKNQRQWKTKPLTEEEISSFSQAMKEYGFTPKQVLPHDSYLINLGNPDPEKRARSLDSFIEELRRVRQLGLDRLNFHPGAHLNQCSALESLSLIAEAIDSALQEVEGVYAVIETTAGQGSALGRSFEEIATIIDRSGHADRIGVCVDTCHIFAAGYDIRDEQSFRRTFDQFESIIGFSRLMGVHLNDAKSSYDSHVDRHDGIGRGNIGLKAFELLMADSRFDEVPLILETTDPSIWDKEIALLRSMER